MSAPTQQVFMKLAPNLLGGASAQLQSTHDEEPRYGDQHRLLSLISHPFSNAGALEQHFRQQVRIGVLDGLIDVDHCELSGRIHTHNASPGAAPVQRSNCGDNNPNHVCDS